MASITSDKNVPWYHENVGDQHITPAARQLLETYSGVAPGRVLDHVLSVREEAWQIFPYPCIGQFRFLDLSLKHREDYRDILKRLQDGQKLLDMACCFGQEIRQLVADGAPAENVYGCDLREDFINLGYKLFLDKDKLRSKFVTADVFAGNSALTELKGQFDIVYVGSFFHLWGYRDQVTVSKAVASLLRSQQGSVIVGRQVGSITPGERQHKTNATGTMFRHNVESFKQQWKEIGDDIGVSFNVDAHLHELEHLRNQSFLPPDARFIHFTITVE